MAGKQKWSVELEGAVHTIEYTPKSLFGGAKIKIDESVYPLYSAKLFGASEEAFMVGGEMASISIAKNKRATVKVAGDIISEIK